MKIKQIFLDIDDVLADFTLAALDYIGCVVTQDDKNNFYDRWGWGIVKAASALHPHRFFTAEEFWTELPSGFWTHLQKTEECDWLIESAVKLVGQKNVFLLTAPINSPKSIADKMIWIRDVLPSWFWDDRQYIIAPPKWTCAQPGALLIDDCDFNVNKFREEGGMATLMPRPWNSAYNRQDKSMLFSGLLYNRD